MGGLYIFSSSVPLDRELLAFDSTHTQDSQSHGGRRGVSNISWSDPLKQETYPYMEDEIPSNFIGCRCNGSSDDVSIQWASCKDSG